MLRAGSGCKSLAGQGEGGGGAEALCKDGGGGGGAEARGKDGGGGLPLLHPSSSSSSSLLLLPSSRPPPPLSFFPIFAKSDCRSRTVLAGTVFVTGGEMDVGGRLISFLILFLFLPLSHPLCDPRTQLHTLPLLPVKNSAGWDGIRHRRRNGGGQASYLLSHPFPPPSSFASSM